MEMKDWNGTAVLEHDSLGRLTKITDHNNRSTGYSYDPAGNITGIVYPDGSTISRAYDKNNRLKSVTDPEGILTSTAMTPQEICCQSMHREAVQRLPTTQTDCPYRHNTSLAMEHPWQKLLPMM